MPIHGEPHKRKPKTRAGKKAKVKKVMGEFKRKTLRSYSGKKVAKGPRRVG